MSHSLQFLRVRTIVPSADDQLGILVGDLDIVSETFFQLRRQGVGDFNFDNVTFALNCIDVLAGDAVRAA